ncbi:hypothetical protein B5E82_11680 [Lachnoclostridium sp. An138]|nr:hypothetical protein B5E82_11680 [Lachnoclostridium sp. An138]
MCCLKSRCGPRIRTDDPKTAGEGKIFSPAVFRLTFLPDSFLSQPESLADFSLTYAQHPAPVK